MNSDPPRQPGPPAGGSAGTGEVGSGSARQVDAIYQNGRLVAVAVGHEVDEAAGEIRFGELYRSDDLLLPEECEFQQFRLLVQRVADATKLDRSEPHKGRILREVTAEILGYREQ